jgi:hypothetical protein
MCGRSGTFSTPVGVLRIWCYVLVSLTQNSAIGFPVNARRPSLGMSELEKSRGSKHAPDRSYCRFAQHMLWPLRRKGWDAAIRETTVLFAKIISRTTND